MATIKPKNQDVSLPFAALQLLAPPVRLVSAALWKVMKQRDVMQYGVVEEFVTSACETVPGLLTVRHQSKLALGLRGRYILELLSSNPDENVIKENLERICAPAALSLASASVKKRDVKIIRTVESFHSLVHILLTDAAERAQFFKDEFPADYGPEFDQELEKLLWEFLIRVDQLLPVPNLAQTVAWLSDTPPVLEECARAATQPQLLKILLNHQTCLGHLETAASLPPNMGDSILDSLSLPLSGKVQSNQTTEPKISGASASFVTPVFGYMSNEEVPVMVSATKRTQSNDEHKKFTSVKERSSPGRSSRMKRKLSGRSQSDSEEEEEEEEASTKERTAKKCRGEEKTRETPHSPEQLCVFQPRVVVKKLHVAAVYSDMKRRGGKPSPVKASSCKRSSSQPQKTELDCPGLDNKENQVTRTTRSSSQHGTPSETVASSGDTEEYVADSEDEATKNFKSRLFMKCYYKTKHGTYVPTLREFRKPWMTQRPLSSTLSKHR